MKKRMTSTPHDAVFKRFLRHPETANDFLTLYLPEEIRQDGLDKETVQRITGLSADGLKPLYC